MNAARVRNAYQKSEAQAEIHPVKLIHLMYERVLTHLDLAEQGLLQKDVKLRGENLSKAIAIITELNAAIKEADNTEAAAFLRGLYSTILIELPKVSISHDVEIIRQASRYIQELKKIWEETALAEAGFSKNGTNGDVLSSNDVRNAEPIADSVSSPAKGYSANRRIKAIKQPPAEGVVGGVSVSI